MDGTLSVHALWIPIATIVGLIIVFYFFYFSFLFMKKLRNNLTSWFIWMKQQLQCCQTHQINNHEDPKVMILKMQEVIENNKHKMTSQEYITKLNNLKKVYDDFI